MVVIKNSITTLLYNDQLDSIIVTHVVFLVRTNHTIRTTMVLKLNI